MSVVGGRLSARLSARVRFVARLRAAEGGWISSPPGRKRWYKSWAAHKSWAGGDRPSEAVTVRRRHGHRRRSLPAAQL